MGYKPTINEILAWRMNLATQERALTAGAKSEEDIYFQSFAMSVPVDYPSIRTGSAPADVDAGVEAVQPTDWVGVSVEPAFDTQAWQTLADKRSKWLRSLLAYWREDEDVLNSTLWGMFVHRRRFAYIGFMDLPDDLKDPPKIRANETATDFLDRVAVWENRRNRHVPFTFELRPLGSVFSMPTVRGGIEYAFEAYTRTVADVLRWYPVEKYPLVQTYTRGRALTDEIAFSAFWSDEWRCAFLEDSPILPSAETGEYMGLVPNQFGIIPFVEFYFRRLPVEDLDRRYRGFLSNAAEMYIAESRVGSQYLAITQRAGWPTTLTRFIKDRPFIVNPGGYFPLKPGESVESYMGEGPLPAVGEAWDRIKFAIKQSSLGAAAGQSQPGVRSASMLGLMQGVDRNKVMPALRNLARGVERALTITEVMLETRYQEGTVELPVLRQDLEQSESHPRSSKVVVLNANDIKGYYDKVVDFGPRFGPEVLERAIKLDQLVKDRWISRRTTWKLVPELITSVTDEEDALYQEASEQHPMMVLAHAARRLQAYDPEMFDLMVQLGVFNPEGAMGVDGAAPAGGGSGAAPPEGGSAATDQAGGSGAPGEKQEGQPEQVGRAVPGATPVQSATTPGQ